MDERQAGDPIPQIAMDKLIASTIKAGIITEHWIIDYPTIIQADHKDTTEPQRKFVKQKCERCNMYALPGSNRCKYHADPHESYRKHSDQT